MMNKGILKKGCKVLVFSVFLGLLGINALEAASQREGAPSAFLFILDASGSMWGKVEGRGKIDIAKEVLGNLIKNLPENIYVGFMVYGHRKKGDCRDVELMVPIGPLDKESLVNQINAISPKGKTPIGLSIERASDALKTTEEECAIILVSDGKETCEGDPCALVEELRASGIDFIMHVIGFDVSKKEREQLECIAKAGGGEYYSAKNVGEFKMAAKKATEEVVPKVREKPGAPSRQTATDEVEPNDTHIQAMEIPMCVVKGNLAGRDEDYYKFEVPHGSVLTLAFTPEEEAEVMSISLQDLERRQVWYSGRVVPGITKSTREMMNNSSGGTYYVRIYNGSGQYTFELSTQSQNDADSKTDAGDKVTQALEIQASKLFTGELGGFDKDDWYKFNIPDGHILNLSFIPNEEGDFMTISLQDLERRQVWYSGRVAPGITKSTREMMNNSSGGTYYVRIYNGSGHYTFELSTQSQNDADSGTDAGDKITRALEIETGKPLTGELGGFDREDWYKFNPEEKQLINFTPGREGESMAISLSNFERKQIWYSGRVAPEVKKTFEIPKVVIPPYFIRVYNGSGQYTFEVETSD
jgi:hypothetical protein